MAYQIIWEKTGSLIKCSDDLKIQEIHQANGELHGHAGFEEHKYQIWNLLKANLSKITENQMIEPAATDCAAELTTPKMRVALVARDEYAVRLCEIYIQNMKKNSSQWECRLFDSIDDARKWIKA